MLVLLTSTRTSWHGYNLLRFCEMKFSLSSYKLTQDHRLTVTKRAVLALVIEVSINFQGTFSWE